MTINEFKEVSAGLQSIAIVVATILGASWALFQFFSLRALDKARLDLEKTKRDLVQRGILVIDLVTESFDIDGSYFLHVQVVMRNIGSGAEIADWTKTSMFCKRFYKVDETTLAATDQVLLSWRAPSIVLREVLFEPGYCTNESFLIPIPEAGVYYIEFSTQVSPARRIESADAFTKSGATVSAEDFIVWRADKFVSVPQVESDPASPPAFPAPRSGRTGSADR